MYGTIFNLNIKVGHEEELQKVLNERSDQGKPKGMIAWFVMKPDANSNWIGVAVFGNKEDHVTNANDPLQHESFEKIMEHLESEPTWTDGTYVIGEIA